MKLYCSDKQLAYLKNRTQFDFAKGLIFDDAYRLAHLPLVAPSHSRIISRNTGLAYKMGKHDLVYSIALPVPEKNLFASRNFLKLLDQIRSSRFAHKISWDTFEKRKDKLHATICGSISVKSPPDIKDNIYAKLRTMGPIAIKIKGLFSGNLNVGRLYLRVYPELRDGKNMCHEVQRIFDHPLSDLYVAGIFNLIDELTPHEVEEYANLVDQWWDQLFLQFDCEEIWLLKSNDDLLLNGSIAEVIKLTGENGIKD